MNDIQDTRILALYILARQEDAASVTDNQKQAIEQLKKLSRNGNPDADAALHRLRRYPDMHPFLKEVLAT